MKIILASQSPRRKILLKKIIPDFEVIVSDADENIKDYSSPADFAVKAALLKAQLTMNLVKITDVLIISADTVVALDNNIYGKPVDKADVKRIISDLMGKYHQVITGFTILYKKTGDYICDYDISEVKIKNLNALELENYSNNPDCYDKAGAYGIQEMKSFENNNVVGNTTDFDIVESYNGSYDNIVGFPTEKFAIRFREFIKTRNLNLNF